MTLRISFVKPLARKPKFDNLNRKQETPIPDDLLTTKERTRIQLEERILSREGLFHANKKSSYKTLL